MPLNIRSISLRGCSLLHCVFCLGTENEEDSDGNSVDEKIDSEPSDTITVPEGNVANAANASMETAAIEHVAEEGGSVEYQEAPSASAVPVPTFTPQQPLTAPASGITTAHSAQPQNLKALPHGMYGKFPLGTD